MLSAPQLGSYLRSYAKHFNLYKNVQFGKTVTRIEKSTVSSKWELTFADQPDECMSFDKVVWATGDFLKPKSIVLEGQDQFAGRVIHSQDVRNLDEFKGQNVIVLGVGNTAADIAANLVGIAKEVYISHRRGTRITSRFGGDGMPSDLKLTHTIEAILWWIEAYLPSIHGKIMDGALDSNFKDNWGENKAEWGFAEAPSTGDGFHTIVCSENLIPLIKEGKVASTKGIKRIVGPNTVEMDDGLVIDNVGAIIACIGYLNEMEILSQALTFAKTPEDASPFPNLYMGIFPPEHANSLALISHVHLKGPQIPGRELMAMAVGQIWAGNSSLPSRLAMDTWVCQHQDRLRKRITQAPSLHRGEIIAREWMHFVHHAAGTGLKDNIGWNLNAWKLWWSDAELYKALAHGASTPHAYRLFETGKRAVWSDARQAILNVNAEIDRLRQAAKLTNKKMA
jgi:dimethylaniline monooxygenase (N-oxide forming)